MTALAVVRNIGSAAALRNDDEVAAFAQKLIDQYALAMGRRRADRSLRV